MDLIVAAHRPPGVPGDPEDDGGYAKADQRIGDRQAQFDDDRAGDHSEADVGVSPSVVAVRDQRRAVEALPGPGADDRRDPVTDEADQTAGGQSEEMGWILWVDQAGYRLDACDAGGDEDRRNDEEAGHPLGALGSKQEGEPHRDRRRGVAEVVNQVSEQGDTAAEDIDRDLCQGGSSKDGEREPDRAQTLARAFDARVDRP